METMTVGEPVAHGPMFMFPLYSSAAAPGEPLTLDEALVLDLIEVGETSLAGSVSELVVENRAPRGLFLLDGEQVLGAKQNRTFNLSMLLQPCSRTVVPVSCLEAGRWSMRSGKMRAAEHVHFAKGRANKMRSVSESLAESHSYRSDQAKVWSDIDCRMSGQNRESRTSAEADYYTNSRERLRPLETSFTTRPNQVGAVVGIGSDILGLDIFASPRLYEKLSSKLLKSYLLDAVDADVEAVAPSREDVTRKINAIFSGDYSPYPAPGAGETYRWSGAIGDGAALIAEDRCIHAVGFCHIGDGAGLSELEHPA